MLGFYSQAHGAAFVTDTFTGSTGSAVTSHTRDDGGSWSVFSDSADGAVINIENNRVAKSGGSGTSAYVDLLPSVSPAGAEYDMEVVVRWIEGPSYAFVDLRGRHDGSDNYYLVRLDLAGGLTLYKVISGTATSIGSYSASISNGNDYAIKFEIRNATKKVYFDAGSSATTQRISSATNDITGAGRPHLTLGGDGSSTNGFHADSFIATDASTPAATIIRHRVIQ